MMVETKSNSEILSYSQKRKGFHEKYLTICKVKILQPLPEVKVKQRNIQVLDFHADRIKVNDWLAICGALKNDKTLKYITIRLRKNDEFVLEDVDTLKKSKTLTSIPVIYSKFLFTELVESLQSMLISNNILEILSLEGLPFGDRYMMSLAKGIFSNRSIKVLNLARSNIGDDGCEILCSNIKHLSNIETLNISNCNFGVKGASAVRDFIKFQKIHRFSEAWIRSLRYQNVENTSFGGLRKIMLNNNPNIGDEGLKLLTDELCEDVWMKDIEMQNCGLTDVAATEIINCLNINKTILSFNVANNSELPDHMYRQILMHLGNSENDSYDSGDSKLRPVKITKSQLMDKIKFLEEQLESEIFSRKQCEELNVQLHEQLIENQKQIAQYKSQEPYSVPDGFTLIANDELELMQICGKSSISRKSTSTAAVKLRHKRRHAIKRVQSLVLENPMNKVVTSKSEAVVKSKKPSSRKQFIERNIGDTLENNNYPMIEEQEKEVESEDDEDNDGENLLEMFMNTKTTTSTDYTIQTLFKNMKPSSRGHYNSEIDSDDE